MAKQNETRDDIVYVRVIADMKPKMQIMPKSIIWEDGREFAIDEIKDVRQVLVSGMGKECMAYFVEIRGSRRVLYLDRMMQWFIIRQSSKYYDI